MSNKFRLEAVDSAVLAMEIPLPLLFIRLENPATDAAAAAEYLLALTLLLFVAETETQVRGEFFSPNQSFLQKFETMATILCLHNCFELTVKKKKYSSH